MRRIVMGLPAIAASTALLLSGCGSEQSDAGPADAAAGAEQAASVEVADAWIKAVTEDDGMTGVFGTLDNGAQTEATVVAASATDAADMVELHEVVTGDDGNTVMQEKDGGFAIAAGEAHTLEPGGDHIMLMELTRDLEPGEEVEVELEFSDGSTRTFTAPVKDYEGANENYGGEGGDGEKDGMDHGEHSGDMEH